MKQRVLAAALTAAMGFGATLPALADGAASTRNIIILTGATAAGIFIPNYSHKLREKRKQQQDISRRQSAYRDWYYKKYGYYPTEQQIDQWYKQTYGVSPQQTK
jgi:hypothetical protein